MFYRREMARIGTGESCHTRTCRYILTALNDMQSASADSLAELAYDDANNYRYGSLELLVNGESRPFGKVT